jgi:transcriptional regulator with PAS, ATPase and Fis domain
MPDLYLLSSHPAVFPSSARLRDGLTIGRDLGSNIRIQEPTVSRIHGTVFERGDGQFWLVNRSDANPLEVNEKRQGETLLALGDSIRIGMIQFTVAATETSDEPQNEILARRITHWDDKTVSFERIASGSDAPKELNRVLFRILELQRDCVNQSNTSSLLPAVQSTIKEIFQPTYLALTISGEETVISGSYRPASHSLEDIEAISANTTGAFSLGESTRDTLVYSSESHFSLEIVLQCHEHTRLDIELLFVIGTLVEETIRTLEERSSRTKALSRYRSRDRNSYEILGTSVQTRELRQIIERVSRTDLNVLVLGESGTGKELVARNIHARSRRSDGPFIAVNCAAVSHDLFESEFFGHVKGSFSGADQDKEGYFSAAHEGTLVLDEVTELPIAKQSALLRILEDGSYRSVGSTEEKSADVRVLALTNRTPEEIRDTKLFRNDLYHRISQDQIFVPPLRDRKEDISDLVLHFLKQDIRHATHPVSCLADSALEMVQRHDWPGNIRELRNVIARAMAVAEDSQIEPIDLRIQTLPLPKIAGSQLSSDIMELRQLEKIAIERAIDYTGNDVELAAKLLGIGRSTLYKKLKSNESGYQSRSETGSRR